MILKVNIVRYTINGINCSESPKIYFKRDLESSRITMDTKITSASLSIKSISQLGCKEFGRFSK